MALLSFLKRKATKAGLTSVVFTEGGVAFAHVDSKPSGAELKRCDFVESSKPLLEVSRFSEFTASKNYSGAKASIVLPEDSYQILLVEKPDLPDDELLEALRWRVKDLVNFDVEKSLIDYIDLPDDAYRNRSKMIYVVVAQEAIIEKYIKWCEEVGLHPIIVDVPEFALLNLTEELADSEAGLAVFHVGEKASSINLLSDEAIYFTRQLTYNLTSSPESASGAVLELQRSMDYYESQIGKTPCVRLMVIPLMMDEEPLITELRYNLPLDVHSLNLENLVSTDLELPVALQRQATVAVAAALRQESRRSGGAQ